MLPPAASQATEVDNYQPVVAQLHLFASVLAVKRSQVGVTDLGCRVSITEANLHIHQSRVKNT